MKTTHRLEASTTGTGLRVERAAKAALLRSNYEAEILRLGGYDIRVVDPHTGEIIRCEIKGAYSNQRGEWHFTLFKAGHTDHHDSDFVIMGAIDRHQNIIWFVIPLSYCYGLKTINITSNPRTYRGKWAKFRQLGKITLEDLYHGL